MWAQFWTLVSAALAACGVTWEPSPAVKATVAAAAALAVSVIQWQHHRTIRHADELAAGLARDKAARTADVARAIASRRHDLGQVDELGDVPTSG